MFVARVYPLDADGAAADRAGWLGDRDGLRITDRTAWLRFGLKGPVSADWLRGAGIVLPDPNRLAEQAGLVVLRLGANDVTLLANEGVSEEIATLRDHWKAAAEPKGYSSWREEAWPGCTWRAPRSTMRWQAVARSICGPSPILRTGSRRRGSPMSMPSSSGAGGGVSVLFDISPTGAVLATVRQDRGHA